MTKGGGISCVLGNKSFRADLGCSMFLFLFSSALSFPSVLGRFFSRLVFP